MKLLHVCQPVTAGVPTVVQQICCRNLADAHHVAVACPSSDFSRRLTELGVVHHHWPAGRNPGVGVVREARRLRRIVDAERPDIVVLHSAKAGLVGRLVLRSRRKTVYVPHAWSFEAATGLLRVLALRWERTAARWTDVLVGMCHDEVERGQSLGIRAAYMVIRNGVQLADFSGLAKQESRDSLCVANQPTVVCVGRLCRQKGQDLLLDLWPRVLEQVPDAQLYIVGDGPDRDLLQARDVEGAHLAGGTRTPATWLSASDVIAVPSRWETMSLVALEGMASARSVVAFEFDGARELLGAHGAVVQSGDLAGFARQLVERLSNPGSAQQEGAAARARAESEGSLEVAMERWSHLLAGLEDSK